MTTPGFTPVNTAEATQFVQDLLLPTQRGKLIGNPDSFANDADIQSALTSLHTRAHESAELIGRITADLTVTTPVRHENAAKVAKRFAEAAETTQLPEVADLTAPPSQDRAFFRLNHLLFRLEDAALDLPWRGHAPGDQLPPVRRHRPGRPRRADFRGCGRRRGGGGGPRRPSVPLWTLSPKERAEIEARFPFLPLC